MIHLGTHLDRSGGWLRNAVAGLGVLAGAAAAVSFTRISLGNRRWNKTGDGGRHTHS